ncbi:MAG: PD-(D/E)XK nuclease family protein [Bacteroidales bacterium]|nr:PD-(D/E)XK nuclease family protein [Bacteroidales bacterium]
MINNLKDFWADLLQRNFDFQIQSPSFNPLEEFVSRVREKENTHSKILADLLNPKGAHNQGSLFFEEFLSSILRSQDEVGVDISQLKLDESFYIKREFCIKEYSPNKSDLGRIDIYIEIKDSDNNVIGIIVENKINDAQFQPDQLPRYTNAIRNKLKNNGSIISVCIPRNCTTKPEEPCVVMTPDMLAEILESATKRCSDNHVSTMMASYITCLRNINKINASMNNAEKLLEVLRANHKNKTLPYRVSDIKAIIDGYNMLPTVYLNKIKEAIEKILTDDPDARNNIKCKIGETSSGYIDVWDERIYRGRQTWQWLSIKADYDMAMIYLVSNEKDRTLSNERAKQVNYDLGELYKGNMWYKPVNDEGSLDESRFHIYFNDGIPDFDKIGKRIKEILKELETINKA